MCVLKAFPLPLVSVHTEKFYHWEEKITPNFSMLLLYLIFSNWQWYIIVPFSCTQFKQINTPVKLKELLTP